MHFRVRSKKERGASIQTKIQNTEQKVCYWNKGPGSGHGSAETESCCNERDDDKTGPNNKWLPVDCIIQSRSDEILKRNK